MNTIETNLETALSELFKASKAEKGAMLVVGCSTSEVAGSKIGTAGNAEAADVIAKTIIGFCRKHRLVLAAQCCEHLNRALVVEMSTMLEAGLSRVNAIPQKNAGGSFATAVWAMMERPVLVESVRADLGIDIGSTLIGMHLKPVVVPVRASVAKIGEAALVCARTRCKFTGGERAVHDPQLG
jgi:uncharacterized protein (TIGR01440 family)